MKPRTTLFFVIMLNGLIANGQHLELMKTFWSDFTGNLGGKEINMSLWADESNFIQGSYCELNNDTMKTALEGETTTSGIRLVGLFGDKGKGTFLGTFKEEYDGNKYLGAYYKGTWISDSKTDTISFKLNHTRSSGGTYEHRYMDLFGTEQEVEAFTKKIKISILQNDINWLADNLNYPLKVSISKNKIISIADKAQFLGLYHQIFPQTYREKAQKYCTCNLWVQANGVAFGRGEIWIHNKNGSTPENYDLAIKEIHAHFD